MTTRTSKSPALAEQCTFPSRHDGQPGSEWNETLQLDTTLVCTIARFCVNRDVNEHFFYYVLWSRLLVQFSDTDQVYFGSLQTTDDGGSWRKLLMAVSMPLLDMQTPTHKLLDGNAWAMLQPDCCSPRAFNTGIVSLRPSATSERTNNHACKSGRVTEVSHPECSPYRSSLIEKHEQTCDALLVIQQKQTLPQVALHSRQSILSLLQARNLISTIEEAAKGILDNVSCPWGQIPLLSRAHQDQILAWNRPAFEPMRHDFLWECIYDAPVDANTVAVDAWDGKLTFRELWDHASSLAMYLKVTHSVNAPSLIPVCFEKSRWAVVAMLAINRCGAGIVPLDPATAPSRLQQILEQVKGPLAVTSSQGAIAVQQYIPNVVVVTPRAMACVDQSKEDKAQQQAQALNRPLAHHPGYCIFTSGSTGVPKGCIVSQRSFSMVAHQGSAFGVDPGMRVLQFASSSVAISLFEVFGTLSVGGTVCMPSDEERRSQLPNMMKEMAVEWALLTPTVLSVIQPRSIPTLRRVHVAGEPCSDALLQRWASSVHLTQVYGMTETAGLLSISHRLQSPAQANNIGNAWNMRTWLVSPQDATRLVPIGAVGELLLEGPMLAEGYLGMEDQTARVFVTSPPWRRKYRVDGPQGLPQPMYRTGDLVHYNSDGSLTYIGRKDRRVKLRGQRLELGEVEYRLAQQLQAQRDRALYVAVELIPSGNNTSEETKKGLVALISLPSCTRTTILPLKSWIGPASPNFRVEMEDAMRQLLSHMNDYMIPRVFIPVQQLPVTPSGKMNRREMQRQLSEIGYEQLLVDYGLTGVPTSSPADPDPPMDDLTHGRENMQAIWLTVLGRPSSALDTTSNFFQLGGDSILAMKVAILARSRGIPLSVSDLFQYPHLPSLVQALSKRVSSTGRSISCKDGYLAAAADSRESHVDRTTRDNMGLLSSLPSSWSVDAVMPVTAMQAWFLSRWTPFCFPFLLEGPIDIGRLQRACETLVHSHSILRTVFTPASSSSNQLVQVILHHLDPFPFRHIRTDACPVALGPTMATKEATSYTPTMDQIPIRFTLLSGSTHRHLLLIRLSHAQFDGYCLPLLFKELSHAYSVGEPDSALPQFYDILTSRTQPIDAKYGSAAVKFWRTYLKDSKIANLPSRGKSHGPNALQLVRASSVCTLLPGWDTGFTFPTLVNAAFSVLIGRRLCQDDIVFGLVMNTRDNPSVPHTDRIIGPCININPLRVQLKSTWRVADLFQALHTQHTLIMGYEDMDWPDLVQHCTDWPASTEVGFILNHLTTFADQLPLSLEDCQCQQWPMAYNIQPSDQVLIRSIHRSNHSWEVQVLASAALMDETEAQSLGDQLMEITQQLYQSPGQLVSSFAMPPS